MRSIICSLILASLAGCDDGGCPSGTCPQQTTPAIYIRETPVMNLPPELRQENYKGGSCYHASIESNMMWQGLVDEALRYRSRYAKGASTQMIAANLDKEGIAFVVPETWGDESFLEWCVETRRGCAITYFANHAVNLVDLTDTEAWVLDNNRTHEYIRIPRAEFLHKWKHQYGGGAIAVVGSPAPPWPQS